MSKTKNSKKDTVEVEAVEQTPSIEEIENYMIHFNQAYTKSINNPTFFDPYLQNEILKNLNMNPNQYDAETIEKMVRNPKAYESELRSVAEHLHNAIMQFKRIVHFYGNMLVFDHYLEPTNADEEDMATPSFKRSYKKAITWLDKFNIRKQFSDVMRMIMLTDVAFYYVRESKDAITLQEMPFQYCKIVSKTDYGYQYQFDMRYFMQTGVNIDGYAPEFKTYYEKFKSRDANQNHLPYWVKLDPIKAPVFKFDENFAGIVPPLMGLFKDSLDIDTYKELLKTKTSLDVYKILLSKIPMHSDGKGTQAKNNFAIDAKTAGEASARIQAASPKGVRSIVTPFETEAINFDDSQGKNNLVGIGNENFYDTAGITPVAFGSINTTATGINTSIRTNEAFVTHMYHVFERFVNAHLRQTTGRFRFKVHMEGTIFDQEERFERALKGAQYGMPIAFLGAAMGKSPEEINNLVLLEKTFGLKDNLMPLVSSHTMSGDSEGGRPTKGKGELSDSGDQTRQIDGNER